MEKILELVNVNKYYKKQHVLKDVNLNIYEKEIVGFIGPNGAGKSTTMKCINNLIFPSSGSIKVCGYDIIKERDKALSCQASLIESPGLYPTMTGLDNLKIFANLRKVSKQRLQEIKKFTCLGDALHKQVNQYSLGMKQRLALGIVLLGKPKLIILDEPTNGLDPKGVMELRESLIKLVKDEETSILFSSHILGEIEKIATRIICINGGKIIETPVHVHSSSNYQMHTSDNTLVLSLLEKENSIEAYEEGSVLHMSLNDTYPLQKVIALLVQHGIEIVDINKDDIDIESVYKTIYGD